MVLVCILLYKKQIIIKKEGKRENETKRTRNNASSVDSYNNITLLLWYEI